MKDEKNTDPLKELIEEIFNSTRCGKVKTLKDMSRKEKKELEKLYGCKIKKNAKKNSI